MSANFIPPIPIGQFKPSSEAIASWLYEVWKYLQENPIPTPTDVIGETERVAQTYIATNVPPMVSQLVSNLSYDDFVTGTSLPIYRASNDEIGPQDLLEAWNEGCRFALVDDDSFYVMIKNGDSISLFQILTENQATGVVSVNGQTGIVVIPDATVSEHGLMSATDKTRANSLWNWINGRTWEAGTTNPNIDVTKANNDLSESAYPACVAQKDANGKNYGGIDCSVYSSGSIRIALQVRNYATDGSRVGSKGIAMTMSKSGNLSYVVDDPTNFLYSLGLAPSEVIISANSTYVSGIGNSNCAYRIGRLVIVSLNFRLNATVPDSGVLFTGVPLPLRTMCTSAVNANGGVSRIKVTQNGICSDGGETATGVWFGGQICYIAAE